MVKAEVKIQVRLKFWVNAYIDSVNTFCKLFGTKPDIEKMTDFISKHGVYTKVIK